jgi:hypothetical protein
LRSAKVGPKTEDIVPIDPEEAVEITAEAVVYVVRQVAFGLRHQEAASQGEAGGSLYKNSRTFSDLRLKR